MGKEQKPDTWRTVIDRLLGDAEKLTEQYVPGKDAQMAVEKARQVTRPIWRFIESTEALYVERIYDLAAILKDATDVGATVGESLVSMAQAKAITVHSAALVRWARNAGVRIDLFQTEAWKDDLKEDDYG